MEQISVGRHLPGASRVVLGCMRIPELSQKEAENLVSTALSLGVNFFDNADIYGGGRSEEVFAKALKAAGGREKVFIQTKCGIRPGVCFDFSREHILESVEGSLKRLETDYIDVLLLHRPDALVEPEEVAEAFSLLHKSGKVRCFGVSNQKPMQIELLRRYVGFPLIANQLQFGVMFTGMVDSGLLVNMREDGSVDRDGSILDYCRLNDITIQPWSPFQYGMIKGPFIGNEKFPEINAKLTEVARRHGVSETTLAVAWILRHPAKMQPVVGTTNAGRLKEICAASELRLSREEWYEIYLAAGHQLP